ncbi:MAG: tRNA (adenosine(37)-N6)-threonylcarbamoyltransferase complex ATPase subunit type 1 TsaE [Defluviitaleaceae bacterium]|nr:tRNA (adenosine(37)-N6)-threonylcarbamoyltransferase complex ATPase subunit type 1 TsaE [Defluviitaleaceae bacterium]
MEKIEKYESFSVEDTVEIAKKIGNLAKPQDIYILNGDLGAGKTIFSKGFAIGLGIDENITSPTFNILNIYKGKLPLYHFDLYRIQNDIYEQGFEEYFFGNGICLIEWGEYAKDIISDKYIEINIEKDEIKGENFRLVKVIVKYEYFSNRSV